jgi:hypothetical protein
MSCRDAAVQAASLFRAPRSALWRLSLIADGGGAIALLNLVDWPLNSTSKALAELAEVNALNGGRPKLERTDWNEPAR